MLVEGFLEKPVKIKDSMLRNCILGNFFSGTNVHGVALMDQVVENTMVILYSYKEVHE
jgi:hypothetical protein